MSNRTYTVDELKIALKGAGLPDYVRRTVYLSLPPAPEPPQPPLLCRVGQMVYRREGMRIVEAGIVATCSVYPYFLERHEMNVWAIDGKEHHAITYQYPGEICDGCGAPYTGVV